MFLTCAIGVETSLSEEWFEHLQSSPVPYWRNIKRYCVDEAEEETKIATPSMKYIEPLMANACHQRYHIRFHAKADDPWHQGNSQHSSANCEWRWSKCYALPKERLWDKAVERNEDKRCYYDYRYSQRREYNRHPSLLDSDLWDGMVKYKAESRNAVVNRPNWWNRRLRLWRRR